jgi:hypothetical protein
LKELLKMSHPLTYTSIFTTLIALGAVACGGATPAAESPVEANEVPAATTESGPAETAADASATATPAPAAEAAAPAPTPEAPAAAAAPAADAAKPADTKAPATGPAATHKKKAAGAKAGCGAGTCG